MVGRRRPPTA